MNVSLNNDFTLSLESDPTTGYSWEPKFDSAFLTLKRRDFEASDFKMYWHGRDRKNLLRSNQDR